MNFPCCLVFMVVENLIDPLGPEKDSTEAKTEMAAAVCDSKCNSSEVVCRAQNSVFTAKLNTEMNQEAKVCVRFSCFCNIMSSAILFPECDRCPTS